MNRKNNIIYKIVSIILFSLLLINSTNVYAIDMDKYIELVYDKIETEEGTLYKRKKKDKTNLCITYKLFSNSYNEKNPELKEIVQEKVKEYINRYYVDCPNEQKIQENYSIYVDIYSPNDENPYKDGDDIVALVNIIAEPLNADSNYWKENFSNNEFSYNKYEDKYYVRIYNFVRLSKNSEKGEYEIAYIDFKPENYDTYIAELKEKGIDLENLDVEKVLNTNYSDEMNVVASSNTTSISGDKTEYDSANVKEIANIAFIMRVVCIGILGIFIIICIVKNIKNKKN